MFAFSKNSVTNSSSTRWSTIKGFFEPLTNVFKIDQEVFGVVLGSLSLTGRLS